MDWDSDDFGREMASAYTAFVRDYPSFRDTLLVDDLRRSEYARLDRERQVYLDYTGGGVYAESQLVRHFEVLGTHVFGNPHSTNPTSRAITERIEQTRRCLLDFFNASPEEYLAIFTANASGALKLVGESYPFGRGDRYLLPFDNHNSVNGIREFARARGASVKYIPVHRPDMRLDRGEVSAALAATGRNRLFAFPAQSNFSGVQHPLDLIGEAHANGWDVLLDAAAFAPTNRLDLSQWKPEFVCLSFYKMFGYPTGIGCLLMRTTMFEKLHRPWFAGGTVQIASVQGNGHYLAADASAFEDGTLDYLNIPAVEVGLRHLGTIGMDLIHERVRCLTGWLLHEIGTLKHANGRPLVHVHGPMTTDDRGGTIAFNLFDPEGHSHDIRLVQDRGNELRISIRTGCFCNPGAGEIAFAVDASDISEFFNRDNAMSFDELRVVMREKHGKEVGAIRVSVGLATNFADVYRFVDFLKDLVDRSASKAGSVDVVAGAAGWARDGA